MINLKFGRLLVIEQAVKAKHSKWKCLCDCGNITVVRQDHLKSGFTKSCGCLCLEIVKAAATKHGCSNTPAYVTWCNMKQRCYNQNDERYPDYGGRGITICDRWRNSFENFLADMGERTKGEVIDRIDNNGNYEPENCRWMTYKVNNRNKRNTTLIEFNGEIRSISDWAEKLGMNYGVLVYRLVVAKWTVERAFSEEVVNGKNQFSERLS